MGSLENTLKMWNLLRDGKVIKKREFAEKLEVSEKQVERYKNALEEFCTIETIAGRYGGYKLIDSYLPVKELLDENEIEELRYFSASLQYLDNKVIFNALNKINYSILNTEHTNLTQIIPYSRINTSYKNIKEIKNKIYESIFSKNEILIEYYDNEGKKTRRSVEPYKIISYKGEDYLVANCLLRNDIRFFKLVRIEECIIKGKKFHKTIDIEEKLEQYRKNSIGIFGGKEYELVLEITPPMANTIKERIWVENQKIEELENGRIIFRATMNGGPELISWILSMRSFVKVLEPKELKDQIKEELKKIIKNLENN